MSTKDERISRRTFLKGGAMLAAIGVVMASGTSRRAYAGVPQAAMQYQDHPKNGQHCSNCIQFVPGPSAKANGTCKIVDGSISPNGYCAAFSAK
ncbi:MAG: high-potential iron-sulfur protein [Betaproteobacteria bacterium]|nr:high-potential iron-sulfur protein [Betaproteobacteria bacterium]